MKFLEDLRHLIDVKDVIKYLRKVYNMEIIILAIVILGTYTYLYFEGVRKDKTEKERFREFVIANKSKDITEYVQAVPVDNEVEFKKEDEIVELDELTPEQLLSIKQKEYDGK